jgi:hypothetical protein
MGNIVVVKLPVPFSNVTVPKSVVPRVSLTVPVGVPANCGATETVNVTELPEADGFNDETIAVVLAAFVMVWEIAGDVLAAYLVSPLYVTVMDFIPTVKAVVDKVAVPPLSVRFPSMAVPDLNVIVPVGAPLSDVTTVAVKVIVCP